MSSPLVQGIGAFGTINGGFPARMAQSTFASPAPTSWDFGSAAPLRGRFPLGIKVAICALAMIWSETPNLLCVWLPEAGLDLDKKNNKKRKAQHDSNPCKDIKPHIPKTINDFFNQYDHKGKSSDLKIIQNTYLCLKK